MSDTEPRKAAESLEVAKKRVGWNRREWALIAVAAVVSVLFLAGNVWWLVSITTANQEAQARTSLENCQQIEVIKAQIRATVRESVARLPTIDYYRKHPEELEASIKASLGSVARFAPRDCYKQPAVVAVGIKKPPRQP